MGAVPNDKSSTSRKGLRRIDPRDFVMSPDVVCPQCQQCEFGILSIYDQGYSRRCRACLYGQHFPLPPVKKTLIYLDQFAISNLLFANPTGKEAESPTKTLDPFWSNLLNKLQRLLLM
jgi:hypothetical protein